MNILLTGGAGYIGSHVAVVLAQRGDRVTIFDNFSNSQINIPDCIARIIGHSIPFVNGDVRDTELVASTLSKYNVDAVVHLAGLKAVGQSVLQPIEYYANNVQGTISVIQAMHTKRVKTLVFSSSATVYGVPTYLPLDERHPLSATNPYARSKIQIEAILRDTAMSDSSWRIACLRYFNPAGAHESGLIGDQPNGVPNNLMPFIAQVALGKRKELRIYGNDYSTPDGTGKRDYIHIMDLAEGHISGLDFLANNKGWHAFNLGAGNSHSVLELVQAFEFVSGKNLPYQIVPRRSGDVAECYANPTKANRLFKWKTKRTIDEMCASAWRFAQQYASAPNCESVDDGK